MDQQSVNNRVQLQFLLQFKSHTRNMEILTFFDRWLSYTNQYTIEETLYWPILMGWHGYIGWFYCIWMLYFVPSIAYQCDEGNIDIQLKTILCTFWFFVWKGQRGERLKAVTNRVFFHCLVILLVGPSSDVSYTETQWKH